MNTDKRAALLARVEALTKALEPFKRAATHADRMAARGSSRPWAAFAFDTLTDEDWRTALNPRGG